MKRFDKFIKIIFQNEGIYSNDKSDSGGETKYGISKKSYPNVDIHNLTIEDAKLIYKRDFYDRCKIDAFNDERLALQVFDFAVNAGNYRAIRTLQKVVKVPINGFVGKYTLAASNSNDWLVDYVNARIEFYNLIGVGKNKKFLKGWLNRVNNTLEAL